MKQIKFRILCILVIVTFLLTALGVRVYFIQVVQGPIYAAMARSQQRIPLSGMDSRGDICDRNGEPLTGDQMEYVYIFPREAVEQGDEILYPVFRLLKELDAKERKTSNKNYRIFSSVEYVKDTAEILRKEYSAYMIQMPQRYEKDQPAVYLLGYVRPSDHVGMTGLEAAFDWWLSQRDPVMYGVADGANRILRGYGIQNEKGRSRRLITTLDKKLQMQLEDIANSVNEGRSCILVTEVKTGEILACATSPGFDPLFVEELLESKEEELLDIALQGQYPPGLIFQLVTAAAAMEEGWSGGGGKVTGEKLLDVAKRLGLGQEVLSDLQMEKTGSLPSLEETYGPGMINVSWGQGSLLVTPLQVAQMTQIIANGGMKTGLWLTEHLEEEGTVRQLERPEAQRVLEEEIAIQILKMMEEKIKDGEIRQLYGWDCGGITGSAKGYLNGKNTTHAWFTGVVPAEQPRFTVTIFVEGGGAGIDVAIPVAEQVLEILEMP